MNALRYLAIIVATVLLLGLAMPVSATVLESLLEFKGIIERVRLSADGTGEIVVSGITFIITSETMLDKTPLTVGFEADVDFERLPDGTLRALQIEVEAVPASTP